MAEAAWSTTVDHDRFHDWENHTAPKGALRFLFCSCTSVYIIHEWGCLPCLVIFWHCCKSTSLCCTELCPRHQDQTHRFWAYQVSFFFVFELSSSVFCECVCDRERQRKRVREREREWVLFRVISCSCLVPIAWFPLDSSSLQGGNRVGSWRQ